MIFKMKEEKNWGIFPHRCSSSPYKKKSSSGDFEDAGEKIWL